MTNADLLSLYGTTERQPVRRALAAGKLTAVLEGGQIRYLRYNGIEVLRAVSWLARDTSWGTIAAELGPVEIQEIPWAFKVRFAGAVTSGSGKLTFRAEIDGSADGQFSFRVASRALTDFKTNRTGFVVLHPDTVAGGALTVGHADGTEERSLFPVRIMAEQPAFEIARLTHEPSPGLRCEVIFGGGIFEMEDQRNWADASFKTYVRPLRLPRPYTIAAGDGDEQSVTVVLAGSPVTPAIPAPAAPAADAVMPRLWLRTALGEPLPSAPVPAGLAHGLIARFDPAAPEDTRAAARFAASNGWDFGVEAILPLRDPAVEAGGLLSALRTVKIDRLLVAGQRDLKTRPSGTVPEGERPLAEMLHTLRSMSFAGRIGAGTPAFFTEFNRNPPPPSDFAWFSSCGIVHAADDQSVFETAGVLQSILDSAEALVPGTQLFPGPLTIAPAVSPYAPALYPNDPPRRLCMARFDLRHAARFGAAYLVAVMARLVGRVPEAAPLFLNGPSGCVATDGSLLPIGELHVKLAEAAGCRGKAVIGDNHDPAVTWRNSTGEFSTRWTDWHPSLHQA